MKAAFITVHVGFNFGSKLQAVATQEMLKKAGCNEVVCVNYIPPRVEEKRYWRDALQSPIRFIRRVLFYPFHLYSKHKYDGYLKENCNLSKPIYSADDFNSKCPKADVYISGSDQLWNYKHNEGLDKHYFFDGIRGKKIAYASSIGMTELPADYAEYMKSRLSKYSASSVRESSAVDMLKGWGLDATLVLDPTFMLNKNDWRKYASKRLLDKPYLFVYLPYNIVDKELIYRTARKVEAQKKLTVVTYSDCFLREKDADKTVTFTSPGDILALFYYADAVVTNSFHGTAFSINLNKQFWVYMPSSFSTRISSILDLCKLNSRLLTEEITESQILETIDFSQSNAVLDVERGKALQFLSKALQ